MVRLYLAALIISVFCCGCRLDAPGGISINNVYIKTHIADSDIERQRGLMFAQGLAEDEGMLFVFEREGAHNFWMKNMRFSLDIIWIGKDKRIVNIRKNAQPCGISCEDIAPNTKAKYVLEVNSGFAQKNNLAVGDKVSFNY